MKTEDFMSWIMCHYQTETLIHVCSMAELDGSLVRKKVNALLERMERMATICPRCRGNGYIKVKESIENQMETIHQCPQCESQGEIMMDEQRLKSIETQRLTLESVLVKELNGIIKKLNDEVDMLTKQNNFYNLN